MNKKILGIGNAIVDVFAQVEEHFLKENNLIKGSMKLINEEEFFQLKQKIKIEKIEKIKPIRITKGIPYFDFNLVVPDDTKYVATNKSGWIYAYPIEIAVNDETCFDVIDESKRIYEIGTCVGYIKNYSGDWKNSLVEIGI